MYIIAQELEGPVPNDVILAMEAEDSDGEKNDAESQAAPDEAAIQEEELEKAMVGDDADQAGDESDLFLIADSDDCLFDFELPADHAGSNEKPKVTKVKSFFFREAYKELEKKGLVDIPRHIVGCSLSFHASSQQRHGLYPGLNVGLTAKFGGTTNRSETEAILKVVRAVITAHLEKMPKDKLWQNQLAKVKHVQATGL